MTLKILAIDTATEQCSVALQVGDAIVDRIVPTARGHADLVLALVDEVLKEAAVPLADLDAIAFGRGPGSFTGVRIAVGVVQGLALAARLPVVGVSNLAAVAQRALLEQSLRAGSRVLVCMDARMQETYWGVFAVATSGLVVNVSAERVTAPGEVTTTESIRFGAGTGWRAYPELRSRYLGIDVDDSALPRAREIVLLAADEFRRGRAVSAANAEPVYVRDQVAWPAQS